MKPLFAIRLTLLLTACWVLSSCTTPYDPSDIGTASCSAWISEHFVKSAQAKTLNEWMFDYFRTQDLRIEPKDAWERGTYSEFSVVLFTSGFCQDHPHWTIRETAKRLVGNAQGLMVEAVI
jgi:hypothetical protein